MFKILITWIKNGKTNTAMIVLVIVFALNKFLGVQTNETDVAALVAMILGAVGQIHKVVKAELAQKVITAVKKKSEGDK